MTTINTQVKAQVPIITLPALDKDTAHAQLAYMRNQMSNNYVERVEDARQYLSVEHAGKTIYDLNWFMDQTAWDNYMWLINWWKPPERNLPNALRLVDSRTLLAYVVIMPIEPTTLQYRVEEFYAAAIEHCKKYNLNPANPGESMSERRKRVNRERMADVRAHKDAPGDVDNPRVLELKGVLAAAMVQAKESDNEHRLATVEAQKEMIARAEARREKAAWWRGEISRIRGELTDARKRVL